MKSQLFFDKETAAPFHVKFLEIKHYFYAKIKGAITATTYSSVPFQVFILIDYACAEDPTNTYMKGNIIGWADKTVTYSGSDNKRETINI